MKRRRICGCYLRRNAENSKKDCIKVYKEIKKPVEKKDEQSNDTNRSLYEKRLLFKIEQFRLARSKWLAAKKDGETLTPSSDAVHKDSDFRKNRHFKTLRPLPYYTLRNKLSASVILKIEEKEKQKLERQLAAKRDEFEDFYIEELEIESKKVGIIDDKKEKVQKKPRKECKKKGPSKKAIQNLRSAKLDTGLLESLKCNDGKEITVVIKGFCLCDKDNIRKFKLSKIRDEYQKLERTRVEPEEGEIKPHLTDSLQVHKKRTFIPKKENEDEEFESPPSNSDFGKRVSFGIKTPCRKTHAKVPCGKAHENVREPRKVEKVDLKEALERSKKQEEIKEREKENKKLEVIEEGEKEIEKQEERKEAIKESGPSKKEVEKTLGDMSSLVTLYKNRPPDSSTMALTKEQFEKLKNNR